MGMFTIGSRGLGFDRVLNKSVEGWFTLLFTVGYTALGFDGVLNKCVDV